MSVKYFNPTRLTLASSTTALLSTKFTPNRRRKFLKKKTAWAYTSEGATQHESSRLDCLRK